MPIISMFYGIIIRLYLLDNQHHNLPHIHAKYGEFEASIGIDDGEVFAGELPRKQLRLVQARTSFTMMSWLPIGIWR